jgi:DNA-binding MarR family transcriptional regulator
MGWRPELARASEAIMHAGLALRRLLHQGEDPGKSCPHKLKPLAAWALFALGRAGSMRASALAEALSIALPNLRPLVAELEAEGLVTASKPAGDKRGLELSLSPAGRELLDKAGESHIARLELALGALSDPELAELEAAAARVEELLRKALGEALDK